jgi:WD repeat-containing protein 19
MQLPDAWQAAAALRSSEAWQQLGQAALELLEVETGLAAYRQAGDASMVLSLNPLRWVCDRKLLSGHLLVLMERDYGQAQVRV